MPTEPKTDTPGERTADTTQLGPVLDFMRLLWRLDHQLQSASKRMETTLGVTSPQRLVIRIVGQFPGITAGEVADILHIHPSTLSGVLKRLERDRVVQRRVDAADARRARFQLTVRGQALNKIKTGTVESAVRNVLVKLTPEQVEMARSLFGMLSHEVELLGAPETA